MATKLTAKKPLFGNKRSKSLRATRKQQNPNLQTVSIDGVKVKISARELRTLNKTTSKNQKKDSEE